jgi:MFS family permease
VLVEQKPGLVAQIKSFPSTVWIANTMEICERMAWYGWFTVMPVYVTGSVATGGLGFSEETRGLLMGVVPMFLYYMPVLTGALADRYGYKKMFIIAYLVMIVAYYSLGQFRTLPSFFMAFMLVAVGAAIFKPVIVGTIARVTNESNSAMAFGIFYMMVNIGGFVGPIVAGRVRGEGWEWVFIASSTWATINLLIVLLFYREPTMEAASATRRTLRKVLNDLVEVLGNLRFFIAVGIVMAAMIFAQVKHPSVDWFTWTHCAIFSVAWLLLNFIYDLLLPPGSGKPVAKGGPKRLFFLKRMHCSNWRFALFLLIMSGFWTAFNQIFITMPGYIRDFVETRPLVNFAEAIFGESPPKDPNLGVAAQIATINEQERAEVVKRVNELLEARQAGPLEPDQLKRTARELLDSKVRLTTDALAAAISGELDEQDSSIAAAVEALKPGAEADIQRCIADPKMQADFPAADKRRDHCAEQWREANAALLSDTSQKLEGQQIKLSAATVGVMVTTPGSAKAAVVTNNIIFKGRQVNPEFIVNFDAGAIVLFQVLISYLMGRFHRFTTMIVGMLIAAVGIGLSTFAGGEGMIGLGAGVWIVSIGIVVFAFGEMMASPTSQEYVGRIAPQDKVALYMGYYFVAIALGYLFGGILSGEFYGWLARDMQRPDLMWLVFGLLMLGTAFVFMLYNWFVVPKHAAHTLTQNA